MGTGSLINRENLIDMTGTAWRNSYLNSCYQNTVTIYIDAPAFQMSFSLWANSGSYKEGSCSVSHWHGSFWVEDYGSSGSSRDNNVFQWNFKHNVDGGTAEDIHDRHLWKIVMYEGPGDGGSFFSIYSGGLEKVPASIYQSHFRGRKIIGVTCGIWEKGTDFASDDEFLTAKGYGVLRGTPIAVQSGTYQYICAGTA